MIRNSKQEWEVGNEVRAGFVKVTIKAKCFTPGDGLPDLYICTNAAGDKLYAFIPHNGLTRITEEEARDAIGVHERHTARIASGAIERASAAARIDALFA